MAAIDAPATGGLIGGEEIFAGSTLVGVADVALLTTGSATLLSLTLALPIVIGIMPELALTLVAFFGSTSFFGSFLLDESTFEALVTVMSSKPKVS